jgi:cell shape-determining protein MreC
MENKEIFDLLEKVEQLQTENKDLKSLIDYYEKFYKKLEAEISSDDDEPLTDKEDDNLTNSIYNTQKEEIEIKNN